jgi:hypothetical protein
MTICTRAYINEYSNYLDIDISMTKYGHIGVSNQSDCWGRLARIHLYGRL